MAEDTARRPVCFVCHSSADKKRFVELFAAALRALGIDAWYDDWEIHPGDSIVQKIEAGLCKADAFVIVLSPASVSSAWVRQELDVGVIRRLSDSMRLIPVVLEECEVPMLLRPLQWVRVEGDGPAEVARRVAAAIHGHTSKPPLGDRPQYLDIETTSLAELDRVDELVFRTVCELSEKQVTEPYVSTRDITDVLDAIGVDRDSVLESLEVLAHRGLVEGMMGNTWHFVRVPSSAYEVLACTEVGYADETRLVVAKIVNEGRGDCRRIADELGLSNYRVKHIMWKLSQLGLQVSFSEAGGSAILGPLPRALNRILRS